MEDDSENHHGRGVAEVYEISSRREDPAGRDCIADAPAAPYEEEEEGFTFAAVRGLGCGGVFSGGRIGPVYPVFGRPRSPPPQQEVEDRDTATVRVPLGQLLLEERGFPSSGQQPDDDDEDEDGDELDGVPAETYCLWSPGSTSPAAAASAASPARCQKSGSTGSVLRWRQRLIGRSHSDGKEKFVFLDAASSSSAAPKGSTGGTGRGWSYYGRGGGRGSRSRSTTPSFLPYKQDIVGLFANAGAFRRSYHPF